MYRPDNNLTPHRGPKVKAAAARKQLIGGAAPGWVNDEPARRSCIQ